MCEVITHYGFRLSLMINDVKHLLALEYLLWKTIYSDLSIFKSVLLFFAVELYELFIYLEY